MVVYNDLNKSALTELVITISLELIVFSSVSIYYLYVDVILTLSVFIAKLLRTYCSGPFSSNKYIASS